MLRPACPRGFGIQRFYDTADDWAPTSPEGLRRARSRPYLFQSLSAYSGEISQSSPRGKRIPAQGATLGIQNRHHHRVLKERRITWNPRGQFRGSWSHAKTQRRQDLRWKPFRDRVDFVFVPWRLERSGRDHHYYSHACQYTACPDRQSYCVIPRTPTKLPTRRASASAQKESTATPCVRHHSSQPPRSGCACSARGSRSVRLRRHRGKLG
jgi:hypothetical protein